MKKISDYIARHKYLFFLLVLIPILIWFRCLEALIRPKFIMHAALDDRIPFLKGFVVFYVLWFLYVPFGVLYTAAYSKKDFLRLVLFLAGGMAVANVAYMLFPNAQDLRPAVTGSDPLSWVVRLIYATDTPTNVCPSMHVINTIAVDAALRHSEKFSEKKYRCTLSFLFAVLVCLSTVFIKQHSILDVVAGLAVSAVFYVPLYILEPRRDRIGIRLRVPGRDNKA